MKNGISWKINCIKWLVILIIGQDAAAVQLSALVCKKSIKKKLAFSLKFVINPFSWNRGSIQGIFLLFRKVFKMGQHAFKLVAGLVSLLDNLE